MESWFPGNIAYWTPTVIVGIVVFLTRNLIMNRLTKAVQHEYDLKIEEIKSNFRIREQRIQSQINVNADRISSIAGNAAVGISERSSTLFQRKLTAAEDMWIQISKCHNLEIVSQLVGRIDVEKYRKSAADAKVQKFADDLQKMATPAFDKLRNFVDQVTRSRLYLPESVSVRYEVYFLILTFYYGQLMALKAGLPGSRELLKVDEILEKARSVLPDHASFLDKFGADGLFALLEPLRRDILRELRLVVDGKDHALASLNETISTMTVVLAAAKGLDENSELIEIPNEIRKIEAAA